jgi:membrane protein implicated in regulation of membrane protease activity
MLMDISSARQVELADRGRVFFVSNWSRPAPSCCGSGSPRCSSASSRSSSTWPWQYQLIAFAVFALASIPLWRRFALASREQVDQPFLNRRADAFVGREFTLEKPIVAGNGTVRIDDTIWRLSGPDARPAAASRSCARMPPTLVVEAI